jgi:hypothetical protein
MRRSSNRQCRLYLAGQCSTEGDNTPLRDMVRFLNSPFGLLLAGSLISGLIVQYIVSHWQQQNWIFQQQFTNRTAQMNKQLDAKYQLLDDINRAASKVFTYAYNVAMGYGQHVPKQQLAVRLDAYNAAVTEWNVDVLRLRLRLQVHFGSDPLLKQFDVIVKHLTELDLAISTHNAVDGSRIKPTADATEALCMMMYEAIGREYAS